MAKLAADLTFLAEQKAALLEAREVCERESSILRLKTMERQLVAIDAEKAWTLATAHHEILSLYLALAPAIEIDKNLTIPNDKSSASYGYSRRVGELLLAGVEKSKEIEREKEAYVETQIG
jgi:hypothetical protein